MTTSEASTSQPSGRDAAVPELLRLALQAHGGLDRWLLAREITAQVSIGGTMWARKGHPGGLGDTHVTLDPHRQWISYDPFLKSGQRSIAEPHRTLIESSSGELLAARDNPREAFAGHEPTTRWDELNVAYFSGYAMWTYLTTPFLFSMPGFALEEIEPWHEDGEVWRRLQVRFPASVPSHSREQTFYLGSEDGLLRRHDYAADVFAGTPTANYARDLREFDGFIFPTARRVVPRKPDNSTLDEPTLVSIDLRDLTVGLPAEDDGASKPTS